MITYVEVSFSVEGPLSYEIAEKVKRETGLSFIRGEKDLAFQWNTDAEFKDMVQKIQNALKGTGAFLRFDTEEEKGGSLYLFAQWPPDPNRKIEHKPHPHVEERRI